MENILEQLWNNGIQLWQDMGRLKFSGNKKAMTKENLTLMYQNKEQLLSFFSQEKKELCKEVATQNQMALWLERKMGNTGGYIHNGVLKKYYGQLDFECLKKAFTQVIKKHGILTCTFLEEEGIVYITQNEISDDGFYFRQCKEGAQKAKMEIESLMQEPLDLEKGPLFRVALYQYTENEYYLAFWAHHIISDAYSLFLIEKDFYKFYDEIQNGISYEQTQVFYDLETIHEEAEYLTSKQYQEDLSYWKKAIDPSIPGTSLPKYKMNQGSREYQPKTFIQVISNELSEQINDFAKMFQFTPYMVMFSVFNLGIHFMNERKENTIGLFAANRMGEKQLKEVGYFSNALVFQDEIQNGSLNDYFQTIKRKLIQSFSCQHVPFTSLVQELVPARESGKPFFNIVFDSLLFPKDTEKLSLQMKLGFEDVCLQKGSGDYDLIVWVYEEDGHYELEYRYNEIYFDAYQIESLAVTLEGIMNKLKEKDIQVKDIPALSGKYKAFVQEKNCTNVELEDKTTFELFCEQADKKTEKLAIRFQEERLSYQETRYIADCVHIVLQKNKIGTGSYVGVRMEKSAYLIPVVLGIWAAGAVYVPIDPHFPVNRQEYMIENTKLTAIIKDDASQSGINHVQTILLEHILEEVRAGNEITVEPEKVQMEAPAYVLYTSGSTGNPKGVVISHGALTNFLLDMKKRIHLKDSDTVLEITSICFDISLLEMFLPMVTGADVVLISYADSKDGKEILRTIQNYKINFMQATPSSYEILYDYYMESGMDLYLLDTCLCGGESYELDLVDKIQKMARQVYNVYGPTETTIWSTVYEIPNPCTKLKIGQPIANTVIRIADSEGKELPVGVPGELLIGGKGVFQGYYNAEELTNAVMITVETGERFYKTGDWAYWNQDCELVFLGRRDSQIKIRGFRVEISEIENVFRKYEGIGNAAVVSVKQNDVYVLAAAITRKEGKNFTKEQVQEYISQYLPEYMRPSDIMFLEELPKTNNNKIDKKAIKELATNNLSDQGVQENKAETELEIKINEIWNEILKTNIVSVEKGFFEAGGDSLLLNRLVIRLQKEFNREIDIVELLTYNTIRKMAFYLRNEKVEKKLDEKKLKKTADRRGRFIQKRKM